MNIFSQILSDMADLFYPPLCITCGERLVSQERYICMNCWLDLPAGRFHHDPENQVARLFWGRVLIEHATAWFYYRKGSRYQKLIHFIKYKGLKELGQEAGGRLGDLLATTEGFASVDLVVPVPLHPEKIRERGYNQSEWIARGLAEAMDLPLNVNNLQRQKYTSTQTRKNRFERWQNVDGIFRVENPLEFENRHILLVDDVVTTGSTLEACACELLKTEGTRVSISTLAFADF